MAIKLKYFKTRVVRYPVLVIAALAAIVTTGLMFDLSKSDWSGWVQAVGSIAALGVALYIMSRQNKHALRLVLDSDIRALRRRGESVAILIQHAVHDTHILAEQLPEIIEQANTAEIMAMFNLSRMKMDEAKSTLTAIPAHELGSHAMTSALQIAISILSDTLLILDQDSVNDIYANRLQTGVSLRSQADRISTAHGAFERGLEQLK